MTFAVKDKLICVDAKGSEQNLTPGWEYKVKQVCPVTGNIHVNDDIASAKVYWNPERFRRSFK